MFNITVGVSAGLSAVLGNMPELSASEAAVFQPSALASGPDLAGLSIHMFDITPPMSTYLVALVMGDLENIETNCSLGGPDDDSAQVRVWATSKSRCGHCGARRSQTKSHCFP